MASGTRGEGVGGDAGKATRVTLARVHQSVAILESGLAPAPAVEHLSSVELGPAVIQGAAR